MKRTHFEFSRVAVNVLWRCANQELELGTSAPRFVFSAFLDQPLSYFRKMYSAFDKNLSRPMDRPRQQCHQATSEGQIAVALLSLIAVLSRNLMVAHPVLTHPFNFRRRSAS